MKSNCEIIRDLLPMYQDGIASDASVQMVEAHLAQCSECVMFLNDIRRDISTLSKVHVETHDTREYVSLAKRIRTAKWYWRLAIAALTFCVIWISVMYAEGYRLSPLRAAHANNIVDEGRRPLTTVDIGDEGVIYIFSEDGLYREIYVGYRFPFWKYQQMQPGYYIRQGVPLQLLTQKSIANSLDNSLYMVYIVAVNDNRVAYIELGKEGKVQNQEVHADMVTFYWNETGNWDGSDDWHGIIKLSELRGLAYAADRTPLYELSLVNNEHVWIEIK